MWRNHGSLISLAVLLAFLAGCKEKGRYLPESTREAATHMEKVFEDAQPQAKKSANAVAQALRENDYEGAVAALNSFQHIDDVSYEQAVAIKASAKNLQAELARRIDTDPAARRAWEQMKAAARN